MNILIILANPNLNSFNHSVAEKCRTKLQENGHSVIVHDLYEENFDPILNSFEIPKHGFVEDKILKHCEELSDSDGIIIIHPNWWGMPPAILKGWIDRVIRPGVAYKFVEGDGGEGIPVGLLKAKVAIIFNTSNTTEMRETEVFKDPLEAIWKNCIFNLCGIEKVERKIFRIIVTSTLEQKQQWLNESVELVENYFPKIKQT